MQLLEGWGACATCGHTHNKHFPATTNTHTHTTNTSPPQLTHTQLELILSVPKQMKKPMSLVCEKFTLSGQAMQRAVWYHILSYATLSHSNILNPRDNRWMDCMNRWWVSVLTFHHNDCQIILVTYTCFSDIIASVAKCLWQTIQLLCNYSFFSRFHRNLSAGINYFHFYLNVLVGYFLIDKWALQGRQKKGSRKKVFCSISCFVASTCIFCLILVV